MTSTALSWTFDGVVRLTRTGSTYIVFTIVIGFAALNTGNNALYIGLTFMLGCLLLSGIASKGGLKHLEVSVADVGEAWAGRPADIVLRVRNRSRLWNVRDVIVTAGDLPRPVFIPVLDKRSEVEVHAGFVFAHRGRIELRTADLYTRYPFGFFLKKRRVKLKGELVVYPRLLDRSVDRERFRPTTGEQTTANRPGPGSEIHSFREFAHGDSLRHVYWKKSASAGRWIIKQTDLDAARTVHVVVDPFRPRHTPDEEFELMISEATTFVHQALQRGLDVILQLPRITLRSKDAQAGHSMFRALALLEAAREPLHQAADRNAVVFSVARETP